MLVLGSCNLGIEQIRVRTFMLMLLLLVSMVVLWRNYEHQSRPFSLSIPFSGKSSLFQKILLSLSIFIIRSNYMESLDVHNQLSCCSSPIHTQHHLLIPFSPPLKFSFYSSLAFLNYPAQLMFKSIEVIPIMVIGAFIPGLRRKGPFHDCVSAILLVVGLILFTLADAQTTDMICAAPPQ